MKEDNKGRGKDRGRQGIKKEEKIKCEGEKRRREKERCKVTKEENKQLRDERR